jgi:mono/diheme cytochrome c family protein
MNTIRRFYLRKAGRAPRSIAMAAIVATAWLAGSAWAAAQAQVERGRYLVDTILACGNCHTPKGPDGQPQPGRELAGGGLRFEVPFYSGAAPNITPDKETGIGAWTDDEIRRSITQGLRPNHGRLAGVPLAPMMWVNFYKALLPADLDAVVAYLRAIPPVRNLVAVPTYKRQVPRDPYPDAEKGFVDADLADPLRRGAYLVTIGHCMECHTPAREGRTLYLEALGKGGKAFAPAMVVGYPQDWRGAVAPNVTSHRVAGLGEWSDPEIKRAITQGISRDGRRLAPPMGFHWYSGLSARDVDAIVAWLRALPPHE